MPLIVPASNRSHAWMLGLALASFVAWLLAPGEGYKMLAGIFTFLLMVVTCITCAAHVFSYQPNKRLILLAAAASLGSCGGQLSVSSSDLEAIVADMHHFTCAEGREITSTGKGLGRDWERTRVEGQWLAKSGVGHYHDLYVEYRPQSDSYELAVPMPDMPSAYGYCKPDPAAPALVHEFG